MLFSQSVSSASMSSACAPLMFTPFAIVLMISVSLVESEDSLCVGGKGECPRKGLEWVLGTRYWELRSRYRSPLRRHVQPHFRPLQGRQRALEVGVGISAVQHLLGGFLRPPRP